MKTYNGSHTITGGNGQLDFSASRPVCVLMPSMGAKEMPDFEGIKSQLEKMGTEVITADLSLAGTVRDLPWDRIDTIDLSNMRGCLTSFDRYTGILDRLYDKIEEQQDHGRSISVTPEYENIAWIASKSTYLTHLNENDIPTIPTQTLCTLQDPDNATIISQPDNFDEMFRQIKDFMAQSEKDTFVLKPSTSSLGRGLFFIERNEDDESLSLSLPREQGKPIDMKFQDSAELESFMMSYFTNTPSPDHHFLFQEYVPNLETSAVFVNGTPHFVERQQGEHSRIAHARYGGVDQINDNPDPEMVRFVMDVMQALPESVQNSPFLRIDVMENLDTGEYILGEIEGAGAARLWLREAGRTEDYARMLIDEGLAQQKKAALNKTPAKEQNIGHENVGTDLDDDNAQEIS